MVSNLPPGCNSADGGIDHKYEAAIESLIDKIETAEIALALEKLIPFVENVAKGAYQAGVEERQFTDAFGEINGQ